MTVAAEPMTRRVIVAPPELTVKAAWEVMTRQSFRHLPVVSGGRLVGILSDRDILAVAHYEGKELVVPTMPIAEIATPAPRVCEPQTDVRAIVRIMTEYKIDALPVINEDSKLVGLVTSTDLLLLLLHLDEAKVPMPFLFEIEEYRVAC